MIKLHRISVVPKFFLCICCIIAFAIIAIPFTLKHPMESLASIKEKVSDCPEAIPNTSLPQDNALQKCIDHLQLISLTPGTYSIAKGLIVHKDNIILNSTDSNNRVRLLADPNLIGPLLIMNGHSGIHINGISFDGNREKRRDIATCIKNHNNGVNITADNVSNITLSNVDIINALCGTGMLLIGSNYEIAHSYIANNGFTDKEISPYAKTPLPHQIADGLTLGKCDHGDIHDNIFENNSDVDLIIGGGEFCRVTHNTIRQTNRVGHAGLWIFDFNCTDCGKGDHKKSYYAFNTISAIYSGSLRNGLIIGAHSINTELTVTGGTIVFNTISNASHNLLIDGAQDAKIYGNHLYTNNSLQNEHTMSPFNNAQFISQQVPLYMIHGKTYYVSVAFKNTGISSWQNGYKLGSQNTQDNNLWRRGRVLLGITESVSPGQIKVFTFPIIAPFCPGKYNFQWQMLQEDIQWFGEKTKNEVITVE